MKCVWAPLVQWCNWNMLQNDIQFTYGTSTFQSTNTYTHSKTISSTVCMYKDPLHHTSHILNPHTLHTSHPLHPHTGVLWSLYQPPHAGPQGRAWPQHSPLIGRLVCVVLHLRLLPWQPGRHTVSSSIVMVEIFVKYLCDELQLKHLRKPSSHRVVAMVIYTSGRDSGYERFTVWYYYTHWQLLVKESLQMHFKVNATRWFPHRGSEGCQCVVVVRWTGQLPLM